MQDPARRRARTSGKILELYLRGRTRLAGKLADETEHSELTYTYVEMSWIQMGIICICRYVQH